ncbi:MAG TPA: alpha/beta hydrolase [Steroidobacteraceae bacterium]|jgi:pimeloyl-ACP methyl ester carboxylesterase
MRTIRTLAPKALLIATCATLAAALCSSSAGAAAPTLQLEQCRKDGVAARCGWLEVPEQPDAVAGKKLRLSVTLIPALRSRAEPDPLVILSGGPGQAASDFYAIVAPAFSRIRRDRDILLVDQRGTGLSNRLDCGFSDDVDVGVVDLQQLQAQARACLAALPSDPRFYTTSVSVRDLDAVRAALGYEKLNFYAVSYGTRVAQHYLRRFPSRVRSIVLDGAVPVDLALGPDAAPLAQNALDAIFARCGAEATCQAAFPDLRSQFGELRAQLEKAPLRMQVADPISAEPMLTTFGDAQLAAAVRLLSYSDETASVLPLLIHQAHTQHQPQALIAQYLMIKRSTETQIAYGMHFAVVCSEDAPHWSQQAIPGATLSATYMGEAFMQGLQTICAVWPHGSVDADFNAPLHSEVPVLILSGGNDPITPRQYGERVLASFPNGKHLVAAGQGHGQIGNGCMPRVVSQFIATGSTKGLATDCVNNITRTPFMLSRTATGP